MCGIVGLFFKGAGATPKLGVLLSGMLEQLGGRGPDSTGFAVYGDAAPAGAFKASLQAPEVAYDWTGFEAELAAAFPLSGASRHHSSHAVFTIGADPASFAAWLW